MVVDETTLEFHITGDDVRPETISAAELAQVLLRIEAAVLAAADARGIAAGEGAPISLIAIEAGSTMLRFRVNDALVPALAGLAVQIGRADYEAVPRAALEEVHHLSRELERHAWSAELRSAALPRDAQAPTVQVGAAHPVPAPEALARLEGTTSIIGRCIRVGGEKPPRAEVRLLSGGLIKARLSEDLARELGRRLYETVVLEGSAAWRTSTMTLERFTVSRIIPYRVMPAEEAFAKLARAAKGRWEGIDAEIYVRGLREEEP